MTPQLVFAFFLCFLAFLLVATPIVYTFLRLAGKIGPDDGFCAGFTGVALWFVCLASGEGLLKAAAKILGITF